MPNHICPKCNAAMIPLRFNNALPGLLGDAETAEANVKSVLPVQAYTCKKCGYVELFSLLKTAQSAAGGI